MVALTERKIAIVRTLVESAPDGIVGRLQQALAETGGDTALAGVRRLVEIEAADRRLRNMVLQPVAPMCVGDGVSTRQLVFPARALSLLWQGLKVLSPEGVAAAAATLPEDDAPTNVIAPFDALTRLAAGAVRNSDQREFRLVAELCQRAQPGGAAAFAACLDLAPVVRRAIVRLPNWIAHAGEETAAAARLAYNDAVEVADDAGPRFFEMLAAQLSPPWLVLRIISAVMDKPTERYLAESEVGGFGERVMTEIDEALKTISTFDIDAGPEVGRAAGRTVGVLARQTTEVEACLELSRDHGWGQRIVNQRKALANVVEARLREAEKVAAAALPMDTIGRKTRSRLSVAPEPRAVGRGRTLLAFTQEIRSSANYAGFSAAHSKALEKIGGMLDHYVEDTLDQVRNGGVEDMEIAAAFLHIAADFALMVRDEKAAELIRRRTATACHCEGAAHAA